MDFDFKVTTWERVNVPEELEEAVLKAVESGRIETSNELCDWLTNNGHEVDIEYEIIPEVEEAITVEENGGCSTIEVRVSGEVVFHNGDL